MGLSNNLSCEAGVSPAAASTPMGVFNQRSEALFPSAGALGYAVCFIPPPFFPVYLCTNVGPWGGTHCSACPVLHHSESALLVYLCVNVGPQGLLVVRLPVPLVPHSASLGPTRATRVLSAPAARLRPSYLSGSMFIFYSLGVRLPCRSIFCQFWLCEEAQCVHPRRHPGSPHLF